MTFKTCKRCNANLDPEEKCNCEKEVTRVRTPEEIKEEIVKVTRAQNAARQKIARCGGRLIELSEELKEAQNESA